MRFVSLHYCVPLCKVRFSFGSVQTAFSPKDGGKSVINDSFVAERVSASLSIFQKISSKWLDKSTRKSLISSSHSFIYKVRFWRFQVG